MYNNYLQSESVSSRILFSISRISLLISAPDKQVTPLIIIMIIMMIIIINNNSIKY